MVAVLATLAPPPQLSSVTAHRALVNGAKSKVDLDLVVLKGDQRKGKTGVGAVPELEGNVKGGLGKGVARSAHLAGSVGITRSIDLGEGRVGDEGKTSGVTNHLEVSPSAGQQSW